MLGSLRGEQRSVANGGTPIRALTGGGRSGRRGSGPRQQRRLSQEPPAIGSGTIHGDFNLSETAALGYYSIVIHSGKAEVQGGFHVEEYKKPEYEVRVNPDLSLILQGQPIQAKIEARYYFGEPVAGARVIYVVHASRYWVPFAHSDEEEFSVEEEGGEGDYYAGEQILEQSGQLDAQGKLTISFPTKVSDRQWGLRYRIEARVTDAANREIAGRGCVLATYGTFVVLIRPDNYLYKPGDRGRFAVESKDYEGKPVATAFRIELRHWRWREEPGATEFTTEGRTSNTGSAQAYVPLPQSGSYPVTVLAQTPEGQEVRATPPSGSKAESEMCTAKRASASRSFPTRSPTAPAKSRVF